MSNSVQRPIILLVEDSEDDLFFFRHALKKTGQPCSFFYVADGAAALQYLKSCLAEPAHPQCPRPDLIFLDLKLPTFSGFDILQWIREQAFEPELEVTILSGSDQTSDIQRANALGATDYMVKPISTAELTSRLTRWMSEKNRAAAATAT